MDKKEKYLSESLLSKEPKKKIALQIADGAITTPKIADGAITTDKLADDAVTPEKLSERVVEEVILPAIEEASGSGKIPENLEQRISTLEDCCNQVKSNEMYSITWATDQWKSDRHVRIIPSYVKKGWSGRIWLILDRSYQWWPYATGNLSGSVNLTGTYTKPSGTEGKHLRKNPYCYLEAIKQDWGFANYPQHEYVIVVDVSNVQSDLIFNGRLRQMEERIIRVVKTIDDSDAGYISGPDTITSGNSEKYFKTMYGGEPVTWYWGVHLHRGYSAKYGNQYPLRIKLNGEEADATHIISKNGITGEYGFSWGKLMQCFPNDLLPDKIAALTRPEADSEHYYTIELILETEANYGTITVNTPKDKENTSTNAGRIKAGSSSTGLADGTFRTIIEADGAHTLENAVITVKQGSTNIPFEFDPQTGELSITQKCMVDDVTIDIKLEARWASLTVNFVADNRIISTYYKAKEVKCGPSSYTKILDKSTYIDPSLYDIPSGSGAITMKMNGVILGDDNSSESHGKEWPPFDFDDLDLGDEGSDPGSSSGSGSGSGSSGSGSSTPVIVNTDGVTFNIKDITLIFGTNTGITGDLEVTVQCLAYGTVSVNSINCTPSRVYGWANGKFATGFTPAAGYTLEGCTPVVSKQGGGTITPTVTTSGNKIMLSLTDKAYVPVTVSLAAAKSFGEVTIDVPHGNVEYPEGHRFFSLSGHAQFSAFITANGGYLTQGATYKIKDVTTNAYVNNGNSFTRNTGNDRWIFVMNSNSFGDFDPTHDYLVEVTLAEEVTWQSPTVNLSVSGGKAKYGSGTAASSITINNLSDGTAAITLSANSGYTLTNLVLSGTTGITATLSNSNKTLTLSGLESGQTYNISAALKHQYTIVKHFTNVTGSAQKIGGKTSSASTIIEGQAYQIKIQANEGYSLNSETVVVQMAGVNAGTYTSSTGIIKITSASGNIEMWATAVLESGTNYGTVTFSVTGGTATGNGTVADGTFTRTITADTGYRIAYPTITAVDSVTQQPVSYEYDDETGVFTLVGEIIDHPVTVTIVLSEEVVELPDLTAQGNVYINVINAKVLQKQGGFTKFIHENYIDPYQGTNAQVTPCETTVHKLTRSAQSWSLVIESPYSAIHNKEMDHADLWDYEVSIDIRDINGNVVFDTKTKSNNNFHKITGLYDFVAGGNAILSGSYSGTVTYNKDTPARDQVLVSSDGHGNNEFKFEYYGDSTISFNNIKYTKTSGNIQDLYVTITFNNLWMLTSPGQFLGYNNRAGAFVGQSTTGSYSRELFSFNAIGRYIDPLLPVNAKFNGYAGSGIWANSTLWGNPQYGETYKPVDIGNISEITGITGTTVADKLADLRNKISYRYCKKVGLDTEGNEVAYDEYTVQENEENGCPFHVADIFLDSNEHVILNIQCEEVDKNASMISSSYTCSQKAISQANQGFQSDVIITATNVDQHLKGSYHVSQLFVLIGNQVVYTDRLVREVYGIITCYPNTTAGLVTTKDVWQGNAHYYIAPSTLFAAKEGQTSMPDLHLSVKQHGTNTDANVVMEYSSTTVEDTSTNTPDSDFADITVRVTPVTGNNDYSDYPELTSTYNNFYRKGGITIYPRGTQEGPMDAPEEDEEDNG